MQEENNNKLVVKHNKLIEFKGRMTPNELKLFSLIIADVREQQEKELEKYSINISILKETTEHKDFYNYLKEVAFRLEEKSIEVENINDKGKRESFKMRLIYRPLIVEDSNHLELLIDKELIPYIIDLKKEFTRYQIENILRLKSSYSIRIYELLKQYEKIGKRQININDLRNYLGIDPDEYKRFDNFEARVLATAKREINGEDQKGNKIDVGADINIDYEKIKTGRRITSILFKIKSKDQENKIYIDYLDKEYDIEAMKFKMGLGKENFNSDQIIEIYSEAIKRLENEEEKDIFEYVKLNYLHIKDKARNKYTYLLKALENDYAAAIGQMRFDYRIEND